MNIEMSITNKNLKSLTSALSLTNTLEVDTLSNMVNLSNQCVSFLDKLQLSRIKIIQDIKNNENNFFEKREGEYTRVEIPTTMDGIFDEEF